MVSVFRLRDKQTTSEERAVSVRLVSSPGALFATTRSRRLLSLVFTFVYMQKLKDDWIATLRSRRRKNTRFTIEGILSLVFAFIYMQKTKKRLYAPRSASVSQRLFYYRHAPTCCANYGVASLNKVREDGIESSLALLYVTACGFSRIGFSHHNESNKHAQLIATDLK